jgi:putative ABC transport system permease protein
VISYSFWQREFGGDASIVGRKLSLNFQNVDIVGVTTAGFSGLEIGRSYDVAVPICSQAALWNEGNWLDEGTVWWLTVMGRVKAGKSVKDTGAHLRATSPSIFQATLPPNYPPVNVKDYLKFKLTAVPAHNGISALRDQYGDPLLLLLATTGLVLAIVCANLANLILARASTRAHEFAVCLAIGASRKRLIQQLMIEGVLLTLCGTAVGLGLSNVLSRLLVAMLGTERYPLFLDLDPDWRTLAWTVIVASLTCILFELTPALQATRSRPGEAMKTSGRTLSTNRQTFGLRQLLVIAQVSLSLVLVISALLFSGSLRKLLSVDTGFQQNGILITSLDFSRPKIPVDRRTAFKRNVIEKIRALPGVTSAGEAGIVPLSGGGTNNKVWIEGTDANRKTDTNFTWISDGYLKTMGMRLLAGREFDEHDSVSSPGVAIVNQSFSRTFGLGPNPIGKRFRREATPTQPESTFEIIGLVPDTKYYRLRDQFSPIAFLSTAQDPKPDPFAQIVVRSVATPAQTVRMVRSTLVDINPAMSVDFQSFVSIVREGLLRERVMATLSGLFGFLGAFIAALGLYGVISYLVVQRTSEIGVRMALGADRGNILGLILRQAGALLTIGLAAGTLMALAVTGAARSILFESNPYDPGTLATGVILLAAITLGASYLPARRAARLEPITALREE